MTNHMVDIFLRWTLGRSCVCVPRQSYSAVCYVLNDAQATEATSSGFRGLRLLSWAEHIPMRHMARTRPRLVPRRLIPASELLIVVM